MKNNSNQDLNCIIEDSVDNLEDLNKKFAVSDILILHINIRSLNANFEKLELLLKSLICKPHVIVCSETWNLIEHKLYSLNGYSIHYNQSSINKADGVIMYVSNALKHSTSVDTIGRCNFLSTCISINNNLNLKVTGMYRCHDIPKGKFINNLKIYMDTNSKIKNHILVGDFNINLNDVDYHSDLLLSSVLDMNYVPFFNNTTRPYSEDGSCIDNMFVKTNIPNVKSITYKQMITDHYILFLSLNTHKLLHHKEPKSYLSYKMLKKNSKNVLWEDIKYTGSKYCY